MGVWSPALNIFFNPNNISLFLANLPPNLWCSETQNLTALRPRPSTVDTLFGMLITLRAIRLSMWNLNIVFHYLYCLDFE